MTRRTSKKFTKRRNSSKKSKLKKIDFARKTSKKSKKKQSIIPLAIGGLLGVGALGAGAYLYNKKNKKESTKSLENILPTNNMIMTLGVAAENQLPISVANVTSPPSEHTEHNIKKTSNLPGELYSIDSFNIKIIEGNVEDIIKNYGLCNFKNEGALAEIKCGKYDNNDVVIKTHVRLDECIMYAYMSKIDLAPKIYVFIKITDHSFHVVTEGCLSLYAHIKTSEPDNIKYILGQINMSYKTISEKNNIIITDPKTPNIVLCKNRIKIIDFDGYYFENNKIILKNNYIYSMTTIFYWVFHHSFEKIIIDEKLNTRTKNNIQQIFENISFVFKYKKMALETISYFRELFKTFENFTMTDPSFFNLARYEHFFVNNKKKTYLEILHYEENQTFGMLFKYIIENYNLES